MSRTLDYFPKRPLRGPGPRRGTWEELKLSPHELTKMVIAGKARIVGRDRRRRHIYELL